MVDWACLLHCCQSGLALFAGEDCVQQAWMNHFVPVSSIWYTEAYHCNFLQDFRCLLYLALILLDLCQLPGQSCPLDFHINLQPMSGQQITAAMQQSVCPQAETMTTIANPIDETEDGAAIREMLTLPWNVLMNLCQSPFDSSLPYRQVFIYT